MNSYKRIYSLLCERANPNTKHKAAAKDRKMARKARKLTKKGGVVRGIHVSKEMMKHINTRGEGSQSSEPTGVTAVRQIKIAAPKHKRGQESVTSSHGSKTTGTDLIRKRKDIPDSDVVKTSTTTKPEGGKDVNITKVHTSKPKSDYETKKATSVVVKKDPKYLAPRGKKEGGRSYKQRTTGLTALTTHPGKKAPRVSKWKKSGHVVVSPQVKEQVRTERPGVHSVSSEDIAKWKRIKQRALSSPAVRARIAALIKSRRARVKGSASFKVSTQ